jgi:Leucine-rich repeat (LRR) protein
MFKPIQDQGQQMHGEMNINMHSNFVAIAFLLGSIWQAASAQDNQNHIDELRKLGMRVTIDDQTGRVTKVDMSSTDRTTDETLQYLASFSELKEFCSIYTKIDGSGLKHLSDKKKLEILHLYACPITDDALTHLTKLKNLKDVNLVGSEITDKSKEVIMRWKKLGNLQTDSLGKSAVSEIQTELPDACIENYCNN